MVLSQILSRCFRDHTPGFRAMNIWQNCFRGAFAVFGKFIRSKQPVIHVYTYDMIYHYFKSLNHPLSRSFRQAFAQLSRAGFLLSRALPSLSPSKALYNSSTEGENWKSLKVTESPAKRLWKLTLNLEATPKNSKAAEQHKPCFTVHGVLSMKAWEGKVTRKIIIHCKLLPLQRLVQQAMQPLDILDSDSWKKVSTQKKTCLPDLKENIYFCADFWVRERERERIQPVSKCQCTVIWSDQDEVNHTLPKQPPFRSCRRSRLMYKAHHLSSLLVDLVARNEAEGEQPKTVQSVMKAYSSSAPVSADQLGRALAKLFRDSCAW